MIVCSYARMLVCIKYYIVPQPLLLASLSLIIHAIFA
jgi:hypothetical protein